MYYLGKAAAFAAAIAVWWSARAEAGSVHIGHHLTASQTKSLKAYEHAVILRDRAPEKFDHIHKLAGKLLSHESVYQALLHEWRAHPLEFKLSHQCVWRVLEGDMIYHELHPFPPSNFSIVGHPNTPTDVIVPPGGGSTPPGNPPPPPPGGNIHNTSVPEPSTWLLMACGLVIVALVGVRRRVKCARLCAAG